MGIDVRLERENGEPVEWLKESLPKSLKLQKLPFYGSREFPLAGCIDPYGDTVFNRLQAANLLLEWADLTSRIEDEGERRTMLEVSRLLAVCRDGVHLYVRFIGD
jgi:hypothetical protein